MSTLRRFNIKTAVCFLLALAGAAPAAATVSFSPALYKAVYTLTLSAVAPGSIVTDVGGEMYDERDDACDAWTTEQRLATRYDYTGGGQVRDTARYAAFESKDGRHFSFNATHEENGRQDMDISGSVTQEKNGTGDAVYTRPGGTRYALPKGYFLPLAHTAAILHHAAAGVSFFKAVLFDGTDAAGPVEANVFIGKKLTKIKLEALLPQGKYISKALLAPPAWPVRVAVFPLKDKWKSTPAYEMDMILHASGIVSSAVVHYKNFSVAEHLTALAPLPAASCSR